MNICPKKGWNKLSENPRWRGGTWITMRGYRKILVKNHPFADRDGYVLEHRWIMEQHIGRYLISNEVIHHKNGNKLDNRIENLELFPKHSDHLSNGHGKKGKILNCNNCGKPIYKMQGDIFKFNFCNQKCINPRLWLHKENKYATL